MTLTLDKPKLDYGSGITPKPRHILMLFIDDRKTIEEIKKILEAVMSHMGTIRITQICEELPRNKRAVLFRGERAQAETYCEQLREKELLVKVTQE